jgi:hypothetical protein
LIISEEEQNKRIKEFKRFCRKNRLRLKESEDSLPIATAIGKFKDDQLACLFEKGKMLLYVRRDTKNQFTFLKKRLLAMGCEKHAIGDDEGVFRVNHRDVSAVAKHLKIVKGKAKVRNPTWLRKTKREIDVR